MQTMLVYTFLLVVVLSILIIKRIQSYWSRQGVFEIRPQFFTGNVLEIVTYKKSWGQLILEFYNEFKSKGVKYGGIYFFLKPTFVPLDPEIIKDILVKNFSSFANRGLYYNEEFEPISANIVALEGKRWKDLRAHLVHTFTTNQRKEIFQSFKSHTNNINSVLLNYYEKKCPVDLQELSASFTTDITVNCLLGMESNCLKNPDCKFFEQGKKITKITWQKSLTLILAQLFPRKVCGLLGMRFTDIEVQDFFLDVVKDTIDYREKFGTIRSDLINVMLQAKCNKHMENHSFANQNMFGLNDIAAQCFVAFIAGHETTATVLKFCLYELAVNQKVQDILRKNIETILKNNYDELSFELVSEIEYLDGVVLETLRKFPVCPVLLRSCNKRYQVPGTNVILDKGTLVNIPILGLHMDPNYHPNPKSFNPDRFSKENRKLIKEGTFLPFGIGPRGCMGFKLGLLMVKAGIIELIRNYNVCLSEDTKTPVELSPNSFFVTTKYKIRVNLNKIVND